jgi:hypothetical protein
MAAVDAEQGEMAWWMEGRKGSKKVSCSDDTAIWTFVGGEEDATRTVASAVAQKSTGSGQGWGIDYATGESRRWSLRGPASGRTQRRNDGYKYRGWGEGKRCAASRIAVLVVGRELLLLLVLLSSSNLVIWRPDKSGTKRVSRRR